MPCTTNARNSQGCRAIITHRKCQESVAAAVLSPSTANVEWKSSFTLLANPPPESLHFSQLQKRDPASLTSRMPHSVTSMHTMAALLLFLLLAPRSPSISPTISFPVSIQIKSDKHRSSRRRERQSSMPDKADLGSRPRVWVKSADVCHMSSRKFCAHSLNLTTHFRSLAMAGVALPALPPHPPPPRPLLFRLACLL